MKKLLFLLLGCFITTIGVILLKHANLVTGGTAGLSLSLSYLMNLPFAIVFFLINIPFYLFSVIRMGWSFTLSTIISVTILSFMTGIDQWLPAFTVPMWAGAVIGGLLIGIGLSIVFMNGSSLGGANILALFLQKRFNINPGKVNFIFDFIVVLSSILTVGLIKGFFSILSIAVTSKVISYYKNEIANSNKVSKERESVSIKQTHSQIPATR